MPDSSTILLVDDEDSVQKLLAYPLERDGYRVLQARVGSASRRARERGDRGRRAQDRPGAALGRGARGSGAAHVCRVRAAAHPRRQSRTRLHAPDAARGPLGRLRVSRAAHDRRPRPASAREARARSPRARADLNRARRRLPLPRLMNPLRSVGARLSLALAFVIAVALGISYAIVVPSLERNLTQAKLDQLRRDADVWAYQFNLTEFEASTGFLLPDYVREASETTNTRVVVYRQLTEETVTVLEDSGEDSSAVSNDPIAVRAFQGIGTAEGVVSRDDRRYAEIAYP